MGVSGLWDIISPAEKKYSLEELALDRITRGNKHLRIAIDSSIWKIQAQSTQGGKNAVLRTLFYRCCRLHALGIRPVFVFDGDQRPSYKRNKVINTTICDTTEHHLFMAMLKLFRFAVWQAKGEAEAECAVLQRLGYVDLIFTTDVDVFLFGGQRVARNWPSVDYEPISCIDIDWIQQMISLDRSDMIFMALLSGSDYGSGINRIGIQVSHALVKLKSHRSVLDSFQSALENGNKNDEDIKLQLHDLMDILQHELNTNQSGHLRRRQHKLDLKTLIDHDQFIRLAMDWIYPKTAILDLANKEAAKTMNSLLNDQDVTPDFVSLASFCQAQFDWSKTITIGKFSRKLYPGYMLHRIISQARTLATPCGGTTRKISQPKMRRKRHHPYFDKHFRDKELFYTEEIQQQRQEFDDLYRIHMIEDIRKNKQDIRLQKLSRCRVEWKHQTLDNFLAMVKTELIDDIGTDADCCTQMGMNSQGSTYHSQGTNKAIDLQHDEGSDDDCIDMTTKRLSPGPEYLFSPPSTVENPANPPPKRTTEDTWMNEYCDPKKCCRQWIGSKLIQKVYPKLMDSFTVAEQNKRKSRRKQPDLDRTQKKLDNFFTTSTSHTSLPSTNHLSTDLSSINYPSIDLSSSNNQKKNINVKTHQSSTPAMHQQHLQFGQRLVLPSRKR